MKRPISEFIQLMEVEILKEREKIKEDLTKFDLKVKMIFILVKGIENNLDGAVSIAIEEIEKGRLEYIDAALKICSKTKLFSFKKRLWLKIAKSVLRLGEKNLRDLLRKSDCPLKIGDIVENFGDEFEAEAFSEVFLKVN